MNDLTKSRPTPEWNMSQEREFMENLLCQRFNFFLVLYSLTIAGAFNASTSINMVILLLLGFVVCCLVACTVYRAHVKHHWIMQRFYKGDYGNEHPIKVVNDAMIEKGWKAGRSVSKLVGIVVPLGCSFFLLGLEILVCLGLINPLK
jgi:Na+/glutamate symporter